MAGEDGYDVDTEALSQTAAAIRAVADAQGRHRLGNLVTDRASYGDDGVHAAFARFCSRWSDGLDVLTKDAATIADTLTDTVSTYRLADEVGARRFTSSPGGIRE